jgi:hypothetical protein
VLELGAMLPRGADECVLARPALLPGGRKPLFARMSRADPLAWLPKLEVRALAAARRGASGGESPRVILLWLDQPRARARALLDRYSGLQLAWGDHSASSCTPDRCPLSARFLDEHVVHIARGSWPAIDADGAEARCRELASHSPAALELVATRNRRLAALDPHAGHAHGALLSRTRVEPTRSGVRVARVELMSSIAAAQRAEIEAELSALGAGSLAAPATGVRRHQVDSELYTNFDVLWEDLQLSVADEKRARAAEQYATALEAMRPGPDVDLSQREGLMVQIGYRLDLLQHSGGGNRGALAQELSDLLERALALHPADEGLAYIQCELWLRELKRPTDALALAASFVDRSDRFRALRREAAARVSVAALAVALTEDGLVDVKRAEVTDLARRIVKRLGDGEAYPAAERAVLQH